MGRVETNWTIGKRGKVLVGSVRRGLALQRGGREKEMRSFAFNREALSQALNLECKRYALNSPLHEVSIGLLSTWKRCGKEAQGNWGMSEDMKTPRKRLDV